MSGNYRSSIAGRLNRILYVAAGCFVVCIAAALISIGMLSSAISSFVDNEYEVATSSSMIMRGNQGMGRQLSQMILSTIANNESDMEQHYTESIEYRALMMEGLQMLSTLDSSAVDHAAVSKALAMTEGLPTVTEQLHEMCVAGRGLEAWEFYQKNYAPTVTSIRETITSVLEASDLSAQMRIEQKNSIVVFAYAVTIGIGVVALIIIYILIRRNVKGIIVPIKQLEQASSQLRQGSLTSGVMYSGADELGTLCENFNESCAILSNYVAEIAKFADAMNNGKLNYESNVEFVGDFKKIGESLDQLSMSLSDDFAKIGESAEQVYSGAEQMSSVSTQLSRSAVEQAGSVQELVNTINTVSEHVSSNASTALEVRDSANQLYGSMTRYSELMKDVNQSIVETRGMTDKVRGVLRNLETISFQTNTLALNAAVEAARAGDAGRGFSVIANEIRELASEANRAASNTSMLMEDMIAKITASADQSQRAIVSLEAILADGNTTAENVEKISYASNNQSAALEQVRMSIRELSQSIQGITSTAEESAASAEQLQSQMKLLNQMVESFEIRKDV